MCMARKLTFPCRDKVIIITTPSLAAGGVGLVAGQLRSRFGCSADARFIFSSLLSSLHAYTINLRNNTL